jgi:regulatory protein
MPVPRPKLSLKARALRYLAAREHSRLELGRKLARHAEEGDDIAAVLDWLQAQKFLSEVRFAESLVNRRAARFGSSRILSELQSHHIEESTVAALKSGLLAGEDERAWEVWRRKFDAAATDAQEAARQMRFLQQRGFSHDAIRAVMRRAKKDGSSDL